MPRNVEQFAMKRARVNGVELAYFDLGAGTPLILIHGWPNHSFSWRPVARLLASNYRVIGVDLRGCGDSEAVDTGFDKRTLAADVRALVDHLALGKVVVVGHDWGVTVSFRFAFDYPEVTTALIVSQGRLPLLASATELMYSPQQARERWYFNFNLVPDLPEIVIGRSLREYFTHLCRQFSAGRDVYSSRDIDELQRVLSRSNGLRAGLGFYRTSGNVDVKDWEQHKGKLLSIPVLALWGKADPVVPPEFLVGLETYVPDLEIRMHETAAHFLPEEEPLWFAENALDFLVHRLGGKKSVRT